jgi:hypothetical protein
MDCQFTKLPLDIRDKELKGGETLSGWSSEGGIRRLLDKKLMRIPRGPSGRGEGGMDMKTRGGTRNFPGVILEQGEMSPDG